MNLHKPFALEQFLNINNKRIISHAQSKWLSIFAYAEQFKTTTKIRIELEPMNPWNEKNSTGITYITSNQFEKSEVKIVQEQKI